LVPGAVLGSYRILSLLGEGAVGRVYLAEHTKLGRKVALKALRPDHSGNARAVQRFFAEARAVNAIAHPHIVAITDFFEGGEHPSHFIMELLSGQTLEQRLHERSFIPWAEALELTRQLCLALDAAHQTQIVHRDLKPANVFLVKAEDGSDFVKLLDFGIAKLASGDDTGDGAAVRPSDLGATRAGDLIGTPGYLSPEQADGEPVDPRSDLYSLGVLLYEMISGHTPFLAGTLAETLERHRSAQVRRPSTLRDPVQLIPTAVEDLLMRCLERDPAARPQTAKEVREAIERIQAAQRRLPRRKWLVVGVVGSAVATAGAAIVLRSLLAQQPIPLPAQPSAADEATHVPPIVVQVIQGATEDEGEAAPEPEPVPTQPEPIKVEAAPAPDEAPPPERPKPLRKRRPAAKKSPPIDLGETRSPFE
jgi:serine/threonine-protein kinase